MRNFLFWLPSLLEQTKIFFNFLFLSVVKNTIEKYFLKIKIFFRPRKNLKTAKGIENTGIA